MADIDPNNVRDPNSKSAQKKEAKRLEREAKLAAKTAKAPAAPSSDKKPKEKKEKDVEEPFVDTTPKGEKKGQCYPFDVAHAHSP